MTPGNDVMNEAAQSLCNKVLRAQVQVNQTNISSFFIKEQQERSRKETELEIKESSIIYNRLHCTISDFSKFSAPNITFLAF